MTGRNWKTSSDDVKSDRCVPFEAKKALHPLQAGVATAPQLAASRRGNRGFDNANAGIRPNCWPNIRRCRSEAKASPFLDTTFTLLIQYTV